MRIEHWVYTIPLRLPSLFRRRQVERELEEELQSHLLAGTRPAAGAGSGPRPHSAGAIYRGHFGFTGWRRCGAVGQRHAVARSERVAAAAQSPDACDGEPGRESLRRCFGIGIGERNPVGHRSGAPGAPHGSIRGGGKVERSVAHAKQTPLKGLRFESLTQAQDYLDHWEERWADTRIHGTTKRQVAAMFAEERPALQPLPVEPFRYYQYGTRTVHLDGCVEVEAAYYGAPPGWVTRRVQVQWDCHRVRLLHPETGALF